jgi:hypothetical protein
MDSKLWWKGPAFLSLPDPVHPEIEVYQPSPDDPELKKVTALATQAMVQGSADFLSRLERFSSWHSMKRAVAVCLRLKQALQDRRVKNHVKGETKRRFSSTINQLMWVN